MRTKLVMSLVYAYQEAKQEIKYYGSEKWDILLADIVKEAELTEKEKILFDYEINNIGV